MTIKTEKISIAVEGEAKPMPAYLAHPDGPGPHPAVFVIEEIFGVNAHIRDVTERVAKEGYCAIAPDIHHRAAPGQELGYDEEGMKKGMELIPKLSEKGIAADLQATMKLLKARKDVRGDRIGIMGFCIGGHVAYLGAATQPFRAAAAFYGGGIAAFSPGGGPPTVTKTAGIKGKILCLFGGKDTMIPQAQVDTIKKELEKHKIRHEVVVYPDAGHGFFCDKRGSYNEAAAKDAWAKVRRLFEEELKA